MKIRSPVPLSLEEKCAMPLRQTYKNLKIMVKNDFERVKNKRLPPFRDVIYILKEAKRLKKEYEEVKEILGVTEEGE